MTPLPRPANRRTDRRTARSATEARVAELSDRLEATERDLERLRNALDGVARERGTSVTVPCRCGRSLLLYREGMLSCPSCDYRRPV
ncbi:MULTISPECIES: hypothetical protein [Saliphagus]|uniref:Uncharacterized protein n=1 Tax=Saliphagus infecundisoli TaxID=1849069 RepID=A0ABD5QDD1_9EURY|nr:MULTISPECIES: hypothetical protein [Saliphagus]